MAASVKVNAAIQANAPADKNKVLSGDFQTALHLLHSGHLLIADDDFAVFCAAKNLEAFPQHVLGHAAGQVVDVKHLAVVLATRKPR